MFNKRFSDIYVQVGNNIRDTSTATQTIIKKYVNDSYNEFLRKYNFDLLDYDYTLNTVSGTQDYALPSNFKKEQFILDTTNNYYLNRTDIQEYSHDKPSLVSTQSDSRDYAILKSPVDSQPTSASSLTFVSDSSSDTAEQVFVRGLNGSGVELYENVTLNGTSSVSTTNSYESIISFTKDQTTGTITVTSNSGAVTNAVMSPQSKDCKRKILRLYQVPTQTLVLSIPYIIDPLPLINDDDVPIIDCSDYIIERATAKSWRYKRQYAKAQEHDQQALVILEDCIWDQHNQPNQEHRMFITPYPRETV